MSLYVRYPASGAGGGGSGSIDWHILGNAGTTPGTNFVGTTDAQNLEIHTNGITQLTFSATGGFFTAQNQTPADSLGLNEYDFRTSVIATGDTSTAFNTGVYNELDYTGNFNYGGNLVANTNRFSTDSTGAINYASTMDNSAFFSGVAGTTSLYKGNNLDVQVGAGYTVTQYSGVNSFLGSTGGIFGGVSLYDSNCSLTDATGDNVNVINSFIQLHGTTAISNSLNGGSFNLSLHDTTSSPHIGSIGAAITLSDSSTSADIQLIDGNLQIENSATATGGIEGSNIGVDVRDNATINDINVYVGNFQLRNAATAHDINTAFFGSSHDNTSVANNSTIIGGSLALSGTSHVTNASLLNLSTNIAGSSTITNFTAAGIFPTIQGSSIVTNVDGLEVGVQVQGSGSISNSLRLGNLFANTNGTFVPQITGLDIDLNSALSHNQVTGLSINNGALSANSNWDTGVYTLPGGEFQHNQLGGQLHIASGFPFNDGSFGFGNNLGVAIFAEDDFNVDSSGVDLGYSVNGLVNQIAVVSGKTFHTINYMAAGGGISPQSTGGTVTNLSMFRALGLLPEGGTLNVTNLYGFKADPVLDAVGAVNEWGVWVGAVNADNWFAKNVVIGGVTGKPTGAYALDVTGVVKINDGSQGVGKVFTSDATGVGSWQTPAISANSYYVNRFTLSGTDITNGFVTLTQAPDTAGNTIATVVGGPMQDYGVDYTVTGSQLSWTGLGLAGVLIAGDKLIIQFD